MPNPDSFRSNVGKLAFLAFFAAAMLLLALVDARL